MAKDVPFSDIFSKLVDNLERVIKAIDGVQHLTTVLSVLIVLCLASVVAYLFWKTRRRAMAWLFFVCLGLFSAFGLLGVIGQWPRGDLAGTDYYVVGTMSGLEEIDPTTRQAAIRHQITPTTEPPSELLVYTTNNGPAPRFEWVARFPRGEPCQTFVHLHIYEGKTKLHTLFVPVFVGGAQTGIKSVHVRVHLANKQAFVTIDGQKYEVSFDQAPVPVRGCTTARLEPAPAPGKRTGLRLRLIADAFSQPPSAQEESAFRAGLESANPAIRLQSRTELARRGDKALPWILATIRDPKSSDALLASLVGALIDMQVLRTQLDAATVSRLLDFLDDDNVELRQNARNLLRKAVDGGIVDALARRFEAAEAQGPEAKAVRLAVAVLDIDYAYGVERYLAYDKNEKDLDAYRAAIAAFAAVVKAADAVEGEEKARFARGHWGLIVAKHHRYWTLPPHMAEAKALRAELTAHFKAMLAVENVKDEAGRPVYRYRHHIDTARRCMTGDYVKACVKGES